MEERYFKDHRMAPDIIHIEDPMGVYATLVMGEDRALLFDTAYGIGNLREHVARLTSLPLTVVNSHGHVDHLCGNYHFDQVYIHKEDMALAGEHASVQMRQGLLKEAKAKGLLPEGFDEDAYGVKGPGSLVPVEEGHCFDLGGLTLEVVAVPGHTPGSIGLLCHEKGLVLLGDAANPFLFLFLPESGSVKEYLGTLYKIKALDFERFIISHFPDPLPKEKIDNYIRCAENIDVSKSKPFDFPPFSHINALIYSHGDRERTDPDYAAIIYTPDRL